MLNFIYQFSRLKIFKKSTQATELLKICSTQNLNILRCYPARGTKPLTRYLWDKKHLQELTGGEYTHRPLRVNRLGGRDPETGHKVNQHIGGGTKFDYFMIDFHRRGPNLPDKYYDERVIEVRHDPNQTAHIALLAGFKGKRWILATENMKAGQIVRTTCYIPSNPIIGLEGNSYPLGALAEGSIVNSIEKYPTEDSESFIINSGSNAMIVRHNNDFVVVRMPNKHEFSFHKTCMATIGRLSHADLSEKRFGSAQMHRRFGYKMSSGLWHKKTGYDGKKIRPLPPVCALETPPEAENSQLKFSLTKRQLSSKFGAANSDPLISNSNFEYESKFFG